LSKVPQEIILRISGTVFVTTIAGQMRENTGILFSRQNLTFWRGTHF
jgi:hypothetical protein